MRVGSGGQFGILREPNNRSSGDEDPADGDHGSFFQVLPTVRIWASFVGDNATFGYLEFTLRY